jgi:hypothetical protein
MSDPTNPYASPEAEIAMAPGATWAQEISPSLQRTGLGLTLVYYGIIMALLSVLVVMFGGMAAGAAGARVLAVVIGAAGIGLLLGAILMFVGPFFCLAVPEESGARGLIVGCVVFQLANVAFGVIYRFAPDLLPPVGERVLNLLGVIGTVLFILFMQRLSTFIGRQDLALRAKNILILLGILIGLVVVMVALLVAGVLLVAILAFVLLILALIAFVMYANLINSLRHALGKQ